MCNFIELLSKGGYLGTREAREKRGIRREAVF